MEHLQDMELLEDMELLKVLVFVTVLSFLIMVLVLFKYLFLIIYSEVPEKVGGIGGDHDHGVKSDAKSSETDEGVQIAGKIDEFSDQPTLKKLRVPEIVDVGCGSPKICNSKTIDENSVYNKINKVEEVEISQFEKNYNKIDESSGNDEIREDKVMVDEDDWEKIEKNFWFVTITELEERFCDAVEFVRSKSNANSLSYGMKMKLHAYYQIAAQGPCNEPHQPMTQKFFARAKWSVLQQLGILSTEQAMEEYIKLLSESIPDWIAENPHDDTDSISEEKQLKRFPKCRIDWFSRMSQAIGY